jgi:ergothioneine biosynthesis protein EgtB
MTAVDQDSAAQSTAGLGPLTPERYLGVRGLTEELAAPLSAEDQTVQSMPDVSPTKWHRAHTSWFFETFLLEPYLPGYRLFHPDFAYLFNSYYEAMGPRYARHERGLVSRPGCDEIARYRAYVDEHMTGLLEGGLGGRSAFLVELGINHEQQHQELMLMDIKHVLSMSPLDAQYVAPAAPARSGGSGGSGGGWVSHDGGLVPIGHPGGGFAFDNEGPVHQVHLAPFSVSDSLVTCQEWLEFIADGGYKRPELWLSDGWAAVQASRWEAPLYWAQDPDDRWTVFTLTGRRAIVADEPVCHISYYEADAFAAWAGARLPTEFEWETIAGDAPENGNFLDPRRPHPGRQDSAAFYGGAWNWTASAYLPYPGFKPASGAVGEYNGKFMINQQVLRGGSCVTPAGHIRPTYRNFFPPSARWPFTGVRLARDV